MFSLLATVLFSGTTIAAAPPTETAPGGYRTLSEQREREGPPRDGEDELTIGSVLFSLGLLRAGAGVLTAVMADRPGMCPDPEQGCGSLRAYGWAGLGEGVLLTGTGIVYLAIGASRRGQYQRWERGEPLAKRLQLSPWVTTSRGWVGSAGLGPVRLTGGGASVQLRF
ncbi:hypothetical protein DB30_06086 [Enhygromyxa salina]|uniref:Uncharacterized protein n=1 Tax=Enhygromyxa salina TaxID=215803 RepID=A0A0C1ZBG8_9BACT|nr:hypothetical protein [Enhygromyxa salina]KIG15054.1 hypothetical protein DB30_06086 [Enhygromyxa salina]